LRYCFISVPQVGHLSELNGMVAPVKQKEGMNEHPLFLNSLI
jgi:hypothetical protein